MKIHIDPSADEYIDKLAEFVLELHIDVEFVDSAEDASVSIDKPAEKEVCKSDLFHAGGRIACPVAFQAAEKLLMSRPDMGKMLNILDIKIFGCQLGCFK